MSLKEAEVGDVAVRLILMVFRGSDKMSTSFRLRFVEVASCWIGVVEEG